MDRSILATLAIVSVLCSVIAYSRGYIDGTLMGVREGEGNAFIKAAGRCFRHFESSR